MTNAIPDLWPTDINVDVLPPIAILKAQEGLLARKTQGMLVARLTTMESENLIQHQLDLLAPSLNFYRERLLSATHGRAMVYPVTVTADCFRPKPGTQMDAITFPVEHPLIQPLPQREAATDEEFVQLVEKVLHSAEVRALIHSLIARINQTNGERQANGSLGQGSSAEASNEGQAGTGDMQDE
jgi:hypothetical protein